MARRGVAVAVGAVIAVGAGGIGLSSLGSEDDASAPRARAGSEQPAGQTVAFVDAHDKPPKDWTGRVFRLSQDYPATAWPGEGRHGASWTSARSPPSTSTPCGHRDRRR